MKILYCFLFSFSVLFADSGDFRLDSEKRYRTPEECISPEKRKEVDSIASSESDDSIKIQKTLEALELYYGQFTEDKRLEEERLRAGKFPDKKFRDEVSLRFKIFSGKTGPTTDWNSIRNFGRTQTLQNSETSMIRNSKVLYDLLFQLAQLYEKNREEHKAKEAYLAAFRNHSFDFGEDYFLKEESSQDILSNENSGRISRHREILSEFQKKKKEIRELIDSVHKEEAVNARKNTLSDFSGNRKKIESAEKDLENAEKKYRDSLLENLLPVQKEKTVLDAKRLFSFGNIMKKDAKHFGYISIFEFAYSLNPEMPELLILLGDEYRRAKDIRTSLDYYIKYITLEKDRFKESKFDSNVYLKAGTLHSELKENIPAVKYFEEYYASLAPSDERQKTEFNFFLSDFYDKRLGNLASAAMYADRWISENEKSKSDKNARSITEIRKSFFCNWIISRNEKQKKRFQAEEVYLEKTYNDYKSLKDSLQKSDESVNAKKAEVNGLKRQLIYSTDPKVLEVYKEEEKSLNLLIESNLEIRSSFKNLYSIPLLLRIAEREEEKRNYEKAYSMFQEIQGLGNETESEKALRSMIRIQNILSDGRIREKVD